MKPFFLPVTIALFAFFQISTAHSQCLELICGDPMALNYDPLAEAICEINCVYPECDDPDACNYGLFQSNELHLCYYPGCTNPAALNYDPNAVFTCSDNSSCLCEAPDMNCNGVVNTVDLLIILAQLGCDGADCPGDLDDDGFVSIMDLLLYLAMFP